VDIRFFNIFGSYFGVVEEGVGRVLDSKDKLVVCMKFADLTELYNEIQPLPCMRGSRIQLLSWLFFPLTTM
jgi:hypothetical protein